jgi:hypothetical protein
MYHYDLNITQLQSYLHQNHSDFKAPLTCQRFKGRQSNPTYLLILLCQDDQIIDSWFYIMRFVEGGIF